MEWGLCLLVQGLVGEAAHTGQGAQNTTLPVGARARGAKQEDKCCAGLGKPLPSLRQRRERANERTVLLTGLGHNHQ